MNERHTEWYIREYICRNGVCEKTKFPLVIGGSSSAYAVKDKKKALRRAEKNATEAKNEAARTANDNFFTGCDYLLTATLSDEGLEDLIARAGTDDPDALLLQLRKEMKLWARRARRKLAGIELRYMAWPSDRDGKKLTPVRPHLHVFVNAGAAAVLAESWGKGFVYGLDKTLYSANHGDLTDLVEYLMAQSRTVGTEKRYIPSRNLHKPEVSRLRLARNPDAPLQIPKDAKLILKSEQRAGRPQKVRYYRESKDRRLDAAADGPEVSRPGQTDVIIPGRDTSGSAATAGDTAPGGGHKPGSAGRSGGDAP
jgi:hypothetical protein